MKDKTLHGEHQKMFTKIDNALEDDIIKFEMNPNNENSIFGQLGKELQTESIKLAQAAAPLFTSVFTRPEQKKLNPLEL